MATRPGDRAAHFPAIEKKYGHPASYWLAQLTEFGGSKYPEQIAFLRQNHGFSQTHANALVMYHRGSTTSRRHESPEQYFSTLDSRTAMLVRRIFDAIATKFPELELVIAWNQPMFRLGNQYVFGLSVSRKHLTLNPFSTDVLIALSSRLKNYEVNKKTIKVPLDWKVDASLLRAIVRRRIAEIKAR